MTLFKCQRVNGATVLACRKPFVQLQPPQARGSLDWHEQKTRLTCYRFFIGGLIRGKN